MQLWDLQIPEGSPFEWQISGLNGAELYTVLGVHKTHFPPEDQVEQLYPYSYNYGEATLTKSVWNLAEQPGEYQNNCPYRDGTGVLATKSCTLVFADIVGDQWSALQNGVGWLAVPSEWADRYRWDIPGADDIFTTEPELSYSQIHTANPQFKGGEITLWGIRDDRVSGDEMYNPWWWQELMFSRKPKLFSVDLDIDGLTENQEENPGGFIRLNANDDNSNGTKDKEENGPYDFEGDMLKIYPYKYPSDLDAGTLKLEAVSGGGKIRVWKHENKGASNLVALPAEWSPSQLPSVLWVEGMAASDQARDIELKLSCTIGDHISEDVIKLTVYGIKKVEWEAIDSPLDDNPKEGGGKRILPGWPSPDPTPNPQDKYQKVKVKVTIQPALSDRAIYFYNIDVDDPSADAAPIDGESGSLDNRGGPQKGEIEGNQWANTNGSGVAERVFKVTLQPGDNFRIVGSLDAVTLEFVAKYPDELGRVYFPNSSSVYIPDDTTSVEFFKATPMLTVWRELWVERNSMGSTLQWDEDGRLVYGPLQGSSSALTDTTLTDSSASWQNDCFIDRCWLFPNIQHQYADYLITGNSSNEITVELGGEAGMTYYASPGDTYKITTEDEDAGDIPEPGSPQDSMLKDAFKAAYVQTKEKTNNYALPWKHYIDPNPGIPDYTEDYSNKEEHNNTYFWVLYAMGAYEYSMTKDGDPDSEDPIVLGMTEWFFGTPEGSAMFKEVNQDNCFFGEFDEWRWKQTTLHEIGHQMSLVHDDGRDAQGNPIGVMYETPEILDKNNPISHSFSDKSINKIRGLGKPE